MKSKSLFLIPLFVFFLISCNNSHITEPESEEAGIRSVDGRIELLGVNASIDLDELDISSFYEDDDIRDDRTFYIDIADDHDPQLVFAVNDKDDFVMAGFIEDDDTEYVINEITTAQAMVLLNVVFMTYEPEEKERVLEIATTCPSFELLVQEVSRILVSDPDNVFNGDIYPDINRLSATVAFEVLENYFGGVSDKASNKITLGAVEPDISIKSSDNRYVTLTNSNFVFMCGQAVDQKTGKAENVFTMGRRKGVLKRALIIPYGITDAEKTDTKFNNNDTYYTINTTKGFNYVSGITNVKQAFNWNTTYGRATILNFLVGAGEVIKLTGLGVVVTVVEQLPLAWDIIQPHFSNLVAAVKADDYVTASKEYIKIVSASIGVLTAVGGAIKIEQSTGFFSKLKKAFKFITDNIPFYSQIEKAEILANETIPFLVDMFAGVDDVEFGARTNSDGKVFAVGKCESSKVVKPTIFVEREGKETYYNFSICSISNFSKELQYEIELRYFGSGTRGESSIWMTTDFYNINDYIHTSDQMQNYNAEIKAVAIDKDGNRSPQAYYSFKY